MTKFIFSPENALSFLARRNRVCHIYRVATITTQYRKEGLSMDPMLALTIIAGIIQVFANWLSLMAVILEFAITICEMQ